MLLSDLISLSGVTPDRVSGDAEVSGMIMDSRKAQAGSLFTAMPSRNSDAHGFIPAAAAGGATAVLAHSDAGFEAAISAGLAAVLVRDESSSGTASRSAGVPPAHSVGGGGRDARAPASDSDYRFNEAVWRLAKVAFGNPSASMKIIGVTGTNGKTTTAWLIRDMLVALGVRAGYLGTLGFQIPGEERELQNTTPFSIELNELLAEARDKGVEAMAIEVSSHALAERRVDGIEFDAAVFTNLTQDHLDFHGTMEAYEAAKLRLFTELPKQSGKEFVAAYNLNDPVGAAWARDDARGVTFGLGIPADIFVLHADEGEEIGIDRLLLAVRPLADPVIVPLGGRYNVENTLAAISGLVALNRAAPIPIVGDPAYEIAMAAEHVRPVPGRFEPVSNEAGIKILVDYAHTPDALMKLLDTVRSVLYPTYMGESRRGTQRIITVFGCGGDRDRNKRPKMAKAASERSDITVITSDNPRTEDPFAILRDVAAGIEGEVTWLEGGEAPPPCPPPHPAGSGTRRGSAYAITDRREAIAHAIQIAEPGDVVVIAGKGHENYQIIGRTKYPMDDRELAREGLARRG